MPWTTRRLQLCAVISGNYEAPEATLTFFFLTQYIEYITQYIEFTTRYIEFTTQCS